MDVSSRKASLHAGQLPEICVNQQKFTLRTKCLFSVNRLWTRHSIHIYEPKMAVRKRVRRMANWNSKFVLVTWHFCLLSTGRFKCLNDSFWQRVCTISTAPFTIKKLEDGSFYFRFTVQLMPCNRTPLQHTDVIIPAYYRCGLLGCVVKSKLHITEYLKILKVNYVTFSAGSTWENLNSATTANYWKKCFVKIKVNSIFNTGHDGCKSYSLLT